MGKGRVTDAKWSDFQTMGAATLKPWDAKIVRTHGTDNRLAFAEHRERMGCDNSKGSVYKQDEWRKECCGSLWQVQILCIAQ